MTSVRMRSAAARSGSPSHDRWLLSYADFVTLLLAVFIVLFASARHNHGSIRTVSAAIHSGFDKLGVNAVPPRLEHSAATPRVSGQPPKPVMPTAVSGQLTHDLQDVLENSISKHEVVIQTTQEGLIVHLQELGFFQSGNAALLPEAVQALQRTGKVLREYDVEVRVEGHSDDQPIRTAAFYSNWELSTARAMSVLSVLVDHAEFPPERIALMGYGQYRPVADNATVEGRRKNRRVDLVIVTPHHGGDGSQ